MTEHLHPVQLLLVILCSNLTFSVGLARPSAEAISGTHFVVSGSASISGFNMKRNATGHIIKFDGSSAELLIWLSQFYNFTYSAFQTNTTAIDSSPNEPGLISHLLRGEIDILISVSAIQSRMSVLDFSHPALYVPVSFLIPRPVSSVKIEAAVKPFQLKVWLALIASIPCVILVLSLLYRNANISLKKKPSWGHTSFYVLGTLLNQGGHLYEKSLSSFWIAGAWCIATFVMVNAYNSTLISHVTLPYAQPLIKSIFDLRNRPDIHFVTDRNLNVDAVLSSADTGFLKFLGDKLREYPKARCNSTRQCVELVKSGSHVYSAGINLYGAMKEDHDATRRCNLQLSRESYLYLRLPWALQKGSHHMKYFNHGIMHMREAGLIDLWLKKFQPNVRQCQLGDNASKMKKPKQLGLKNVMGAFVVLAVGCLVSVVVFVSEEIIFYRCSQMKQVKRQEFGRSALVTN